MEIRRKDNPCMVLALGKNAVRTEQGWLVPIFSELPDDLFITYLSKDWELVGQEHEVYEIEPVFG